MLEELSQETVTEYANEALTIQEPQGTDYTQGVKVGKTIPAKWWNWLFNAVTKRLGQSKTDAQNMLSELQNTVTDAGIELDSSDSTQLSQAIGAKTDIQINNYINKKRWYYSYWHNSTQQAITGNYYYYCNQGYGVCYVKYSDPDYHIQYCSVCVDGAEWHEVPVAQYIPDYYKNFYDCILLKFKDIYILTVPLSYNTGTGDSARYLMLVSTDAVNWTPVTPFGDIDYQVYAIEFFICEDTLYALSGPREHARLYYTSDGMNWDFKSMQYNMNATNDIRLAETYKFNTKYLVGNSIFDPLTKEFTVLGDSSTPNALLKSYVLNGDTAFVRNGNNQGFYRITSDGTSTLVENPLGDPSTDYKVMVYSTEITSDTYQMSFSYDGENIVGTLEVQSPLSSCVYVNGYYYVANQRTTDFVNWEPIPNLPQGTFIAATGFDNILAVVDSSKHLKYVSYDYAVSWVPVTVEPYSVGDMLVDNSYIEASPILVHVDDIYFAYQHFIYSVAGRYANLLVIYTISDSINRVIGHTLYLR